MPFVRLTAALAAACACVPAAAAPSAHARVDLASVTYTIADTDPLDGLGASFARSGAWMWADACIGPGEAAVCGEPGTPSISQVVPVTAQHVDRQLPGAAGTATIAPTFLQSDLTATGGTGPKGVNANHYETVTFTGSGRVTVQADYHMAAGGLDGLTWRETLAWVGIILFPDHEPMRQVDAIAVAPGSGPVAHDGRLSISYDFVDGQRVGVFMQAHTHQIGLAAPVPEPGTAALVLAGLAAIGTTVRRRRT